MNMKIGDVLYLKSGSPKMTVVGLLPSGMVTTTWVCYHTGEVKSLTALYHAFKPAPEYKPRAPEYAIERDIDDEYPWGNS